MGRLFGTDGVRGVANTELNPSLAYKMGKAAAIVLGENNDRPLFVIGKDTRISGDMLENALTAGILSAGGDVLKLGVIPTPGVAYLVKHYKADAGVVISASHNSFEYNGIKFFNGKGFKLDDDTENEIEDIILDENYKHEELIGGDLGRESVAEDALSVYVDFLLSTFDGDLKGKKIVLDTANGAAYQSAKLVYESLGADLTVISNEPDGININASCGSTHTENLQTKVVEVGADIGFAYDGDADRLIVIDDLGRVVDGDRVMCICGEMLQKEGALFDNKITATVMSNIGLHKHLEKSGITVDVTKVGDRYVLESMLKTGSVLGGEQSGHMIFLNHTTTGDGTLSSLQFMKAYLTSGKKVSELRDEITIYPQALVNARVTTETKAQALDDAEVKEKIDAISAKMEGRGRVLIRPSGTEPLIRVMLEGEDTEEIQGYAENIANFIVEKFGEK